MGNPATDRSIASDSAVPSRAQRGHRGGLGRLWRIPTTGHAGPTQGCPEGTEPSIRCHFRAEAAPDDPG